MPPYVKSLRYRLRTDECLSFKNPEPVEDETPLFKMRLENDVLTFTPKVCFSSVKEARESIDEYLRAWEIYAGLQGYPNISFTYETAEILPDSNENRDKTIALSDQVSARESVIVKKEACAYPSPPKDFAATPDAATMWFRYKQYLDGREPLPSMAYFCFTILTKQRCSNVEEAAEKYRARQKLLKKLRCLTSRYGGHLDARKANAERDLTSTEREWIKQVIKALIRRVGELQCKPKSELKLLTLGDFPTLPND